MVTTQTTYGTAFQKLHNFLINCESATYGQTWNVLDTPEMVCLLLSKQPGHIKERWNRSAMQREPDFADLIHLFEDEATLVNDTWFSNDTLSGYVHKRKVPVKRKQLKKYVITANENRSRSLRSILSIVSKGS